MEVFAESIYTNNPHSFLPLGVAPLPNGNRMFLGLKPTVMCKLRVYIAGEGYTALKPVEVRDLFDHSRKVWSPGLKKVLFPTKDPQVKRVRYV
ncbi:hypothetical protein KKH23_07200 [Patescibacteria group bacterium]|nr:hypothetical protein [Patescibacteria group bacterium]